jgi:hypothetical protein
VGEIDGSRESLLKPEEVFPAFAIKRSGSDIKGQINTKVVLLGEVSLPFHSRLVDLGLGRAGLEALAIDSPPPFWAELSGEGHATQGQLHYQMHLRVHAQLPEGEKWGGKALRRMVEATFERAIERVLGQVG